MLKCEKCGIEYPSEIDFHQRGVGGQLICIQCPKPSGGQQEGEGPASDAPAGGEPDSQVTAVKESVGEGEKTGSRFSKGGLIAAAIFIVVGVLAARDPDMSAFALMYFLPALALGIRSFTGGMTWGRGILTALGGMLAGMVLVMLALVDSDNLATLIVPVLMTFGFLWSGFKRGPIQWKKKG